MVENVRTAKIPATVAGRVAAGWYTVLFVAMLICAMSGFVTEKPNPATYWVALAALVGACIFSGIPRRTWTATTRPWATAVTVFTAMIVIAAALALLNFI